MDPKKRFFLKNPPGFLAFEKSSSKLTSNQPFWTKKIQPGRQEGPKTAKMGYFWRYQSSSKLTSNGPIWLKQIYRDIKFILRGLPGRCDLHKLCINVQLNGGDGVKKQMQPAMRLQMSTIVLSRSVQFITRFRKTLLRVTFPAFHFLIFEVMRCFSDQLKFPDL